MGENIKAAGWLLISVILFSALAAQTFSAYDARSRRALPPSQQFITAHNVYLDNHERWEHEQVPVVVSVSDTKLAH